MWSTDSNKRTEASGHEQGWGWDLPWYGRSCKRTGGRFMPRAQAKGGGSTFRVTLSRLWFGSTLNRTGIVGGPIR
jgi:hypothetical protein